MFTQTQEDHIRDRAKVEGYDPPAVRGFLEVEAANQVYATVGGKLVPLIRYEGHYFDKLVKPALKAEARKRGLASSKVGGIKNPATQEGRYALLARAKALDYDAAVASTSYGIGQVMGDNWQLLGFSSVREFEKAAMSGFEGQLDLVFRFLKAKKLKKHINDHDWAAVARIYNGPKYAVNKYDIKMRDAYIKYSKVKPVQPVTAGMLRIGSKGPDVRAVQALLQRAGFNPGNIDGDFGPTTKIAVENFQRNYGIVPVDGVVGPKTQSVLNDFRSTEAEELNKTPVTEVEEVKQAGAPLIGVGTVVAFKDSLTDLATNLTSVSVETATTVANYVTAGASLIGVGLAVYAVYGYVKARKNVRGIEDKVA